MSETCWLVVHCGGCGRMVAAWDAMRIPPPDLGQEVLAAAKGGNEITLRRSATMDIGEGCKCDEKEE